MAPKVLISDKLSPAAVQIFKDRGIDVDFQPDLGKDKDALLKVIGNYDGLAIRSATKATEKIINAATNLKVIGRAGIGTDNVDKEAASKAGVIVMNTPFGNIGGIACDRARALQMKVMAYDPYLGEEKAEKMGVKKVELDELLAHADFITLHVPFTDQTANILSADNIAKLKKGVRIVNCARGGLVDETALAEALKSGHVAGAAFDVFAVEPATDSPLFNLPNVVVTPHLGAATTEAQENVALQVAEQMSDYLLTGAVSNALNMPSVTAEEAKIMGPWIKLSGHLGNFTGQMTDEPIQAINILFDGSVSEMNLEALKAAVIAGIMKKANPDTNMVSAPVIAKERGIQVSTTKQDRSGVFEGYVKVTVVTSKRERSVAGTVFSDGKPRFIQIKGINVDAEIGAHMLYTTNEDVPGIIGTLGQTMGANDVNIANFTLGRAAANGEAIALLYVDSPVPAPVIKQLEETGMFQQVKPLTFDA